LTTRHKFTALTPELYDYVVGHGVRRDEGLERVERDTEAMGGVAVMQTAPDQGALITLLVGAIRRGSRLATAMDARGFDSGIARTNARGSVLRRRDWLYVAAALAVCGGATAASIAAGTWAPIFVA